jgi:hypothetical protein
MGNFYVNFTVKRDDPRRIAEALRREGRKAVVTPPVNGYVVVYEEESDSQDTEAIEKVGALLSRGADAPVFAVLNHDDDVLCYWLFQQGRVTDAYNSCPDYFGEPGEGDASSGGDANLLREALSASCSTAELEAILRGDDDVFAFDRHAKLVEALGLPACSVAAGYRYIVENEEIPEDLDPDQLIHVG